MLGYRALCLANRSRFMSTETNVGNEFKRECQKKYFQTLYFILPMTTIYSGLNGLFWKTTHENSFEVIHNVIGCSTYGFLLGLAFPVTFPLISVYTLLLKNPKN